MIEPVRAAPPRPQPRIGDHVPLAVSRPVDVFHHPSVLESEFGDQPRVRLHVPRPAEPAALVEAVPGAPGFVQPVGEEVYGTLHVVLAADASRMGRMDRLLEGVRTRECADVQVANGLCGSGARARVSPFPGDVDCFETVVVQGYDRRAGERLLARRMVESAREAERQGLVLAAIQVEDAKYVPGPDGIEKREGWKGRGLKVAGGLDEHLVRDLARELGRRDHDFLKMDFIAPVDGCYRDVTKNMRYAVENPSTGLLTLCFPTQGNVMEAAFEEAYRTPEEAVLVARVGSAARDGGLGGPESLRRYVAMLEREVEHHADKPLKVANRLFNRYAALGEWDKADLVAPLLSRGPARASQVAAEMGTLSRALERGLPLDRPTVATQVASFLDRLADASPERAAALEDDLVAAVALVRRSQDRSAAKLLASLQERVQAGVSEEARAFLAGIPDIRADLP